MMGELLQLAPGKVC